MWLALAGLGREYAQNHPHPNQEYGWLILPIVAAFFLGCMVVWSFFEERQQH